MCFHPDVMSSCVSVAVLTDDASALAYRIQSMGWACVQNMAYAVKCINKYYISAGYWWEIPHIYESY